jgi:NAD(P)-dependent dehydrogenase (short-subunit alcohol dehydrogenase family)
VVLDVVHDAPHQMKAESADEPKGSTMPSTFNHESTASEVIAGVDLTGKVALVTGASSGLGAETARAFAEKGAHVVMTARDMPKGEAVAASIRRSTANDRVEVEELELGSLASIRAFGGRFLARHPRLDILVNNAGVMACPFARTADGFEMQFGTNHLGHFLMTCLIAPALVNGAPSRVVSLSSRGHRNSPVVFDDIHFERRPYDKWLSYGQSKTANVLFAVELDRRLGSRSVRANAVHPGVILTELARHMVAEDFEMIRSRQPGGTMKLKSVEAGAATSVYAATAPELEGRGGLYIEDCAVAEVDDREDAAKGVRSYALDPDAAARLWQVSEEMVGERFALG